MDSGSFLPFAKEKGIRGKCCSDWGLSMFQMEEQAKTAFEDACRQFRNFRKNGWAMVAEGRLDDSCGVATVPDGTGHFDLYEFTSSNLHPLFAIKCSL